MKKHVNVVGALIKKDNLFYICQRSRKMSLPLYWEFPGGKIEVGESNEEALVREIQEELSCEIEVVTHLNHTYYEYDTFTIDLFVYECKLINGEPCISEHAKDAWITVDCFDEYEFAPADVPAVKYIKEVYAR